MISSIIGAGSNLISNIFGSVNTNKTNKANLQINKMNNQFNEQMLNKQLDYQTEMWNKTNEYNDPSNARKRLENAGYNPSSYFSNEQAGSATAMSGGSASASSPAHMQAYLPDFSGVGDAINRGIELSELRKNNEIQRADHQADIDLKRIESHYRGAKLAAELLDLQSQTRDRNTRIVAQEISNSMLKDMLSADLANKRRQERLFELEEESRVISNAYNNAILQNYGKQFSADMAEQYARIYLLKQQGRLTDRQVDTELEKALKTSAERSGINLENRKKYATLESDIRKAYYESLPSALDVVGQASLSIGGKLDTTDWENLHKKGYKKPWN